MGTYLQKSECNIHNYVSLVYSDLILRIFFGPLSWSQLCYTAMCPQ